MILEPVIEARLRKFKEFFELQHLNEDEIFEKFVNHVITISHQPDAFTGDADLLDIITVGGSDDIGIDGIGIKLNDLFVKSKEDIDDISNKFKRANAEFIFIQSKNQQKFKADAFLSFSQGVRSFFDSNSKAPINAKIKSMRKFKDYLFSHDMMDLWEDNPSIRLYYVALGKWKGQQLHTAHAEKIKDDLNNLNMFSKVEVHFIDSEALKLICDNNDSNFKVQINAIEVMPLTEVAGVDNSCIALCKANEFFNIIKTDEGVIRKSLFDNNVRDFQGESSINKEIGETIINEPEKMVLLNNGITLVCDKYLLNYRSFQITNPQIVNGCQTSHVLYNIANMKYDISNVTICLRIISTTNLDISNKIVRGTNRQNIVLDEAFEATRKFHIQLEDFFSAYSEKIGVRLFYERRSKQFAHNPKILQSEKSNLRTITQSFVGMFLNKPHLSHRHEAFLLDTLSNELYQDSHSNLPYFISSLSMIKVEKLFREGRIKGNLLPYKAHILMLFREIKGGKCPNINHEKKIDSYCSDLIKNINNSNEFATTILSAVNIINHARQEWIDLHKNPYRDVSEFTTFLLSKITESNIIDPISDPIWFYGKIVKILYDKNGKLCGFIQSKPDDIFFHSAENTISTTYLNKYVKYQIREEYSRKYGINISLLE